MSLFTGVLKSSFEQFPGEITIEEAVPMEL